MRMQTKQINNIFLFMVLAVLMSAMSFAAPSSSTDLDTTSAIAVNLVSVDPDPAVAGEVADVRIGIYNSGGKAVSDLMVGVEKSYPFEPAEEDIAVGTIQGYQGQDSNQQIAKLKVKIDKDAVAGEYTLRVRYYVAGSGVYAYKDLQIDVKNTDSAEIISIDKTVLVPGQETPLEFTITNVGSAPLRDLRFNWLNSDNVVLPVGSDNTKYIKYIGVGESVNVEYKVIADTTATAGLYKLDLSLSYKDALSNSDKTITSIAGVYVGGGTDFDVTFSESSGSEVSFSIANIGSNPANSVSVIIPEQRGWTVSGSSASIIGNLNVGDYTVASFNIQSSSVSSSTASQSLPSGSSSGDMPVPNDSSRNYRSSSASSGNPGNFSRRMNSTASDKITIQVAYTDTMGLRKTVEKQVKMTSLRQSSVLASATGTTQTQTRQFDRSSSSNASKYIWAFAGVIVLIAGFFLYRNHKKKKMMMDDTSHPQVMKKR